MTRRHYSDTDPAETTTAVAEPAPESIPAVVPATSPTMTFAEKQAAKEAEQAAADQKAAAEKAAAAHRQKILGDLTARRAEIAQRIAALKDQDAALEAQAGEVSGL